MKLTLYSASFQMDKGETDPEVLASDSPVVAMITTLASTDRLTLTNSRLSCDFRILSSLVQIFSK